MREIELAVNGRRRKIAVGDDELLLDVLRREFGTTSVREGCGVGACGACTVLVSGRSVSSCLARAARYDGAEVSTADGLPKDDDVVEEFVAAGAVQCGYCIPGFVMMTHELLGENPQPSEQEIGQHLEGNICRCGTYEEIRTAIGCAAKRRQVERKTA
ncbi:(2Fe-2S)-binding protein [Amycolatopsis acidiphila]|uniref:(2Fe-2S)-binding protein n=1 Tax=Amycolatopsis acidiphila TaxID=715473 RepID=A0A558A202_9PSEU|nr:(2Fe-2S)-binding protein [Amycolatopsis acidiphila]TVT18292.1 (2Fe-2S)-binding protein [Amycolatopsis acidiphila]UIJ57943.1 (2Fe-2S)-binding protein [Amycolatopsis acidiphila]GHG70987.1 (2Fe-2S)-binding protein [Amycolatopsis acidiphila]